MYNISQEQCLGNNNTNKKLCKYIQSINKKNDSPGDKYLLLCPQCSLNTRPLYQTLVNPKKPDDSQKNTIIEVSKMLMYGNPKTRKKNMA